MYVLNYSGLYGPGMCHVWEKREVHAVFSWKKPKEKRHFGRPRHRCEHDIKIYLQEIGWKGVIWIHLARDRDKRTAMNIDVP
jgi:hypothetical protein